MAIGMRHDSRSRPVIAFCGRQKPIVLAGVSRPGMNKKDHRSAVQTDVTQIRIVMVDPPGGTTPWVVLSAHSLMGPPLFSRVKARVEHRLRTLRVLGVKGLCDAEFKHPAQPQY